MTEARKGATSLIIAITNPQADVRTLVEDYDASLTRSGHEHEFVFVLDGIGGQVDQELRALAAEHPIKIVRLQGGGMGESVALSAGVERASGEFIIHAPGYMQAEPDDLFKIIQALDSGADVVATWRLPRVDPWLNQVQSKFFNWCLRILMGNKFHDLNSSVRGIRRSVFDDINVYGELYRFLPVVAMRRGFRVVEVKVRHREEKGRIGFYGFGVYVRRLLDIVAIAFLTRFTQRPLRFFGMLGLISMVIGMALTIRPLWVKFVEQDTIAQPILVLGAILVAFGIQLIGFGLVGEIIIFTQARNLRDYKIDEDLSGVEEFVPDTAFGPVSVSDSRPLQVRELLPGEDSRWDAFVRHQPDGSFHHLTGWRKVTEDVFHHQPHYLVAEQGRQWLGVLPLFWVKSPFLGRNLISVPYGVYGGVLGQSEEARRALITAAADCGRELGAQYLELRHVATRCEDLPQSDLYVTFQKALPDDVDAVLPSIPKKARAEVRRARDRFGVTFHEFRDLDLFYQLFSGNKRSLGSPSLPRRWFRSLIEEFGTSVVMHIARSSDDEPMAAVMSFCFKNTIHAYYSGAHQRFNRTGVNDFIYCRIMEWAVRNGFGHFDFGRSRKDTGPASFKKHMGFTAQPLHYEYLLFDDAAELPEFHPSNPKLRVPQRIWSSLPPIVAERLGGRLSRYLP